MFAHNLLKRHTHCLLLGSIIVPILAAGAARAAIVINFDENGSATVTTTAGTVSLPSLGNQTDPFDPTNGLTPLVYDLSSLASIAGVAPTDGDINLLEPQGAPGLSDLIRFEHGLLVVYSELPETGEPPQLADVGLPINRQMNLITRSETGSEPGLNGLFGYTPGAGDPGDLPTPPGAPTYNFISDPAVPEPSAMGLLLLGSVGLLARRRR